MTDVPSSADPQSFRRASRQFTTGVTIATARDGAAVHAITATAFCPLSLDPPMVLLALDKAGRLLSLVRSSGHVGVNILGTADQEMSEWAATHGRQPGATLPGADVVTAATGAPLLRDALAWFDCVVEAEHDHGDHVLLVARVIETSVTKEEAPLLYFRGEYHDIGAQRDRTRR